ncbi:MAG: galactosyltransferase-related protein [Terracoccus sp.]
MSAPPVVALVTLAHGRHDHLLGLLDAVGHGTVVPDHVVVAAMDDPEIAPLVEHAAPAGTGTHVIEVGPGRWGLPLAAARNRAARRALELGADVLVFLDVDCLAGPTLVERYAATVSSGGPARVLSGAVHYLGPRPSGSAYTAADLEASRPHPARPVAPAGSELRAEDVRLFWSLSFALSARTWLDVGGFDETYEGYGGEDTDFAMRLDGAGVQLWWLGGAAAHHQHHAVESPPRGHLADIVRNANLFRQRWGWFPMEGWLARFEDEGLVTDVGSPPAWHLTTAGHHLVKETSRA